MKISDKGLALIRQSEGFSATPYQCPAGKWTIGFGSTFYPDGQAVRRDSQPLTVAQALELLRVTLTKYEGEVNRSVQVAMTQSQFDALVSLCYNIGGSNFRTSTLLRKLNDGSYGAAADQFLRWDKSGGVVLPGLVKRREAERKLFLSTAPCTQT